MWLCHMCIQAEDDRNLVLSHFGLGKYVLFVAFVGFSFKLGSLKEEEQYLSF